METKFNFNSQICTTRQQSKRLLALGIKRETADMYYSYDIICAKPYYKVIEFMNGCVREDIFPSWSLHRLIEIMPQSIYHKSLFCFLNIDTLVNVQYSSLYGASQTIEEQFMKSDLWENLINCIEWLIKEGYFPKKYLEE